MPTSVVENEKLVEEGDVIEGAAKKADDVVEGDDDTTGKTVGFEPKAIMGSLETGQPIEFAKSQDPELLNAWNGIMPLLTAFKSPKLYPGSMIRTFEYPIREPLPPEIIPWSVSEQFIPNVADPYRDFDAVDSGGHQVSPLRFKVGNAAKPEVEDFLKDTTKYLNLDYLNYYTDWSQRCTSNYFDKNDYFPIYFQNGEGTSIYNWFTKVNKDIDDSDNNVNKLVDIIWKRVHPPSYYLFRQRKIAAFRNKRKCAYNTATYRKLRPVFGEISQEFSIMKKRIIGLTVGDGMHFAGYLIVNFGAHFQEGGITEKTPTFIANCDSLHGDDELGIMDKYIQNLT
jgi:hypothetical protein